MLEHYKENAGAAFRKELDIVCADMRSSSYEAAPIMQMPPSDWRCR